MSCLADPPSGKYRWKHRICTRCKGLLSELGYVTDLGRGVFYNQEVPPGDSGLVMIRGQEIAPPSKKLSEAKFRPGQVKIRSTLLRGSRSGKKWVNVEKTDIARLRKLGTQDGPYVSRLVGPCISGAFSMVSAMTEHNRLKALVVRMFRSPPPPEHSIWEFAKLFNRTIWPNFDSPPEPMSDEDWLASMPGNRKLALGAAQELYKRTGWCKKYEQFSSFVKKELLPWFSKTDTGLVPLTSMVDRLINAPHDVTHVIAGPKIKPYLGWLKNQWHYENFLFYGGVEPEKLHLWLQRVVGLGPRLVFWSDYSMFDASHNEDTFSFIMQFYEQHRHDREFMRVLEAWKVPKGTIGRNIKYRGRTMNASGRDDTALLNALLNGIAMVLSVTASWYRIPVRDVKPADVLRISQDLCLSVCGDDALGFLPPVSPDRAREFIAHARSNLKKFGFDAKMFASNRLEDAVYLGHRPLPVDGVWYWTRTLGRCLYKLGYQADVSGDPRAHFHGICKMHDVCSKHVPVLADITQKYLECFKGYKCNEFVPDQNKPWETMGVFGPDHYSQDTIDALARAYTVSRGPLRGDLEQLRDVTVTAADIRACIDHCVKGIHGGPCVLDHWVLRHMVWIDEQ